jgi:hypothetical protein
MNNDALPMRKTGSKDKPAILVNATIPLPNITATKPPLSRKRKAN